MKVLTPLFDWLQERATGVLLHPTALPGDTGIGTLGEAAFAFVGLLREAGIRYWQICPLGPTGFGDSPYQSFSAFAGNPYLIDLETLVKDHCLTEDDLAPLRGLPEGSVDFGLQWERRWPILRKAADHFLLRLENSAALPHEAGAVAGASFRHFCQHHADWLEPYALYSALKRHYEGRSWYEWPPEHRDYASAVKNLFGKTSQKKAAGKTATANAADKIASVKVANKAAAAKTTAKAAVASASAQPHGKATANTENLPLFAAEIAAEVKRQKVLQYWFAQQWQALRAYAAEHDVEIIGDIPIFVSLDSADVWSRPELYELNAKGRPTAVAGVPPDYFSPKGQLWGNPLYRWAVHEKDDFAWWRARLAHAFAHYDIVRLDHFRGFDTYWRIPAGEPDARRGKWMKGPGLPFFETVAKHFPDCRLIAEDLGDLSDSVRLLRAQTGLPGMAILQFGFGDPDSTYLPHNLHPNCVLYPGTHDNDTSLGWYEAAPPETTDHMRRYLGVSGGNTPWDFVRCGYASVCRLFVVPLQDLLSLGTEARFNTPGIPAGNWTWRASAAQLEQLRRESAAYLLALKELYRR